MRLISVIVYKDDWGNYPNGCIRAINSGCKVLGTDSNVYLEIYPIDECAGQSLPKTSFLKVKDPNGKSFWIGETTASWSSKINSIDCCGFGAPGQVITITGGTFTNIFTSPQLYGLTIGTISKGGTVIYNVPYSSDPIGLTGTLDLTAFGGFGSGEVLQVTLKS